MPVMPVEWHKNSKTGTYNVTMLARLLPGHSSALGDNDRVNTVSITSKNKKSTASENES